MTERGAKNPFSGMSPKSLSQTGQAVALPHWDPLVRLVHWGLATVVIGNQVATKSGGSVHVALGWVGLALLILRLVWGFLGPDEARFSAFPPNPLAALRHLGGLMRGRAPHFPSHNPAGAMMAYALWACLGIVMLSGLAMSGLSPFKQAEAEAAVAAGDWSVLVEQDVGEGRYAEAMEEVHEVAVNLILVLAVLHVAGVFVEGRVMRRNLLAPMLFARKGKRG